MAGASRVKNGRIGPFQLTRRFRYKSNWDGFSGDNLGKVYEAYNVHTGASAVVVIPDRHEGWWPSESWQVRASTSERPPYVALEVEQAPASGLVSTVGFLCELFTTVLARMDESKEARAHLKRQPVRRLERWADRWRRLPRSRRRGLAVAPLAVLGLGVACWLYLPGGPRAMRDEQLAAPGGAVQVAAPADATILVQTDDPRASVITYPLPSKPFDNQAKAPCKPKKGELEINGGCWVALEKRPPCYEDQAEYQGKCYLPVAERRKPEPNSLQP